MLGCWAFDVSFKNPPGQTSLRFQPSPGFGGQAEASAFTRIAGQVGAAGTGAPFAEAMAE
jgi:hypothetical protein